MASKLHLSVFAPSSSFMHGLLCVLGLGLAMCMMLLRAMVPSALNAAVSAASSRRRRVLYAAAPCLPLWRHAYDTSSSASPHRARSCLHRASPRPLLVGIAACSAAARRCRRLALTVHRMRHKTHHWVFLGAQSTWVPSPSSQCSPSSSCAAGPPSPASMPMTARARVPAPLSCLARLRRFRGPGCPAAGLSPAQRRGPVAHPPWPVVLGFLFFLKCRFIC
jgi:hypothetical protein